MERLMIESALRAVLLAIATWAVLKLLRVNAAAGRHAAWTITLLAMLLLPLWMQWGPSVSVRLASTKSVLAPAVWQSPPPQASSALAPSPTSATRSAVEIATPLRATVTWRSIAWVVYLVGALLLLARLAVGTLRARRLIRSAVVDAGQLTSASCAAPITVGWIRPVVILPQDWKTWSAAQIDAVSIHEQEHVRRRDPLVQWLSLLNRAVFWFHPLAWWLERRLAALAEEACDSAVLAHGHDPADYSEHLLRFAQSVMQTGTRLHLVGTTMPGAFLSRRIRRILDAAPELPLSPRRLACTLVLCTVTSAVVGAMHVVPPAEQATLASRAAAAQQQATATTRLPEFWFDDDEWHLEVESIMTAGEQDAYKHMATWGDRERFIAEFWKRRDPTPATDANEFQREFERRIAYSKERFVNPDSAAIFGYQTDRGRWYVTFGPPATIVSAGPSVEEWRYRSLPALGSDVVVQFEPRSFLACSYRGGKYRIMAPAPLARFNGSSSTATASKRPSAATYPGGFVYLTFPIDAQAIDIRWGLRSRRSGDTVLGESRGPTDYIQGQLGSPEGRDTSKPLASQLILAHLKDLHFFEPDGVACTEQLPADVYTLWVEMALANGAKRADSVTFQIE